MGGATTATGGPAYAALLPAWAVGLPLHTNLPVCKATLMQVGHQARSAKYGAGFNITCPAHRDMLC